MCVYNAVGSVGRSSNYIRATPQFHTKLQRLPSVNKLSLHYDAFSSSMQITEFAVTGNMLNSVL
jgi:hypothetical protein